MDQVIFQAIRGDIVSNDVSRQTSAILVALQLAAGGKDVSCLASLLCTELIAGSANAVSKQLAYDALRTAGHLTDDDWDVVCRGMHNDFSCPDPDVTAAALRFVVALPGWRVGKFLDDHSKELSNCIVHDHVGLRQAAMDSLGTLLLRDDVINLCAQSVSLLDRVSLWWRQIGLSMLDPSDIVAAAAFDAVGRLFSEFATKKMSRIAAQRLVPTESSAAVRAQLVVALTGLVWGKRDMLIARAGLLTPDAFRSSIYPLAYAARAFATGLVDDLRMMLNPEEEGARRRRSSSVSVGATGDGGAGLGGFGEDLLGLGDFGGAGGGRGREGESSGSGSAGLSAGAGAADGDAGGGGGSGKADGKDGKRKGKEKKGVSSATAAAAADGKESKAGKGKEEVSRSSSSSRVGSRRPSSSSTALAATVSSDTLAAAAAAAAEERKDLVNTERMLGVADIVTHLSPYLASLDPSIVFEVGLQILALAAVPGGKPEWATGPVTAFLSLWDRQEYSAGREAIVKAVVSNLPLLDIHTQAALFKRLLLMVRGLRAEADRMVALASICRAALCVDLFSKESARRGQRPVTGTDVSSLFDDPQIKEELALSVVPNVESGLFREELLACLVESAFQLASGSGGGGVGGGAGGAGAGAGGFGAGGGGGGGGMGSGLTGGVGGGGIPGEGYGGESGAGFSFAAAAAGRGGSLAAVVSGEASSGGWEAWGQTALEVVEVCRACVRWQCGGRTYAVDCYLRLLVRLCQVYNTAGGVKSAKDGATPEQIRAEQRLFTLQRQLLEDAKELSSSTLRVRLLWVLAEHMSFSGPEPLFPDDPKDPVTILTSLFHRILFSPDAATGTMLADVVAGGEGAGGGGGGGGATGRSAALSGNRLQEVQAILVCALHLGARSYRAAALVCREVEELQSAPWLADSATRHRCRSILQSLAYVHHFPDRTEASRRCSKVIPEGPAPTPFSERESSFANVAKSTVGGLQFSSSRGQALAYSPQLLAPQQYQQAHLPPVRLPLPQAPTPPFPPRSVTSLPLLDSQHLLAIANLHTSLAGNSTRLIVIDSIAALVRIEFGADNLVQRQQLLSHQASKLKYLAESFCLPVLVTNHVASASSSSSTSSSRSVGPSAPSEADGRRAALGAKWSHCVNVRLLLSTVTHAAGSHRVLHIAKAPMAPQISFPFAITNSGLQLF
ncbi:hypothetical protein CLOP_g725 [Closterium sp. NIES-67]|nr:hypothetical protein CLOP_g725 [Closterium sp. NIES-67]